MTNQFGEILEKCIEDTVDKVLSERKVPTIEYIQTDNLGEVVEKLVILHIRTWMLEDAIQEAKTDSQIAELKKKIDTCFKIKRPSLVQAINALVDNSILTGKTLREDSVKLYKKINE